MLIEINNFLSFYFVFAKKKHNKYNINNIITKLIIYSFYKKLLLNKFEY